VFRNREEKLILDQVKITFMDVKRAPLRFVTDPDHKSHGDELVRQCKDVDYFFDQGFVHVRATTEDQGVVVDSFNSAMVQTIHTLTLNKNCENCKRPGCNGEPVKEMKERSPKAKIELDCWTRDPNAEAIKTE